MWRSGTRMAQWDGAPGWEHLGPVVRDVQSHVPADPQLAAATPDLNVAEVDSVNRVWANAFAQGAGGMDGMAGPTPGAGEVAIATLRGQHSTRVGGTSTRTSGG